MTLRLAVPLPVSRRRGSTNQRQPAGRVVVCKAGHTVVGDVHKVVAHCLLLFVQAITLVAEHESGVASERV